MTDRLQQYLPTMQQIPSSSLYELWVNMSGITQFVPPRRAGGWKTNSRLFAKQLIIKKWCICTAAHKDSSWFEFSQVEDTEWDRCQWLSARWNLSPNNIWLWCYQQTFPRWFRGPVHSYKLCWAGTTLIAQNYSKAWTDRLLVIKAWIIWHEQSIGHSEMLTSACWHAYNDKMPFS